MSKEEKNKSLKTIDWDLGIKLANNKSVLAKELLTLLVAELPQTRSNINQAFQQQDFKAMHQQIHKLHGACCYCGVPRLKEIVSELETKLRAKNLTNIEKLLQILNHEIEQILVAFQRNDYETN